MSIDRLLFCPLVVDYILTQSKDTLYFNSNIVKKRNSCQHPAKRITELDFANDVALILDTLSKMQELLSLLEIASNKVRLSLNANKTKYRNVSMKIIQLSQP